ncbi:site-specific integrase [Acidobacteria bacterium AH-259-G07]|nr:site-specific integrase [Acidobacteria bacterium AH-259-G07]
MLELYYVRPDTVDRIRTCWISGAIESYVSWLSEREYSYKTISRRIPLLVRFGEFAREGGAQSLEDLSAHVDSFIAHYLRKQVRGGRARAKRRKQIAKEVRIPIEQMLSVVLADFVPAGRQRRPENPFQDWAPGFFDYLRREKGLRESSLEYYTHYLRLFASYLEAIGLKDLHHLSPPILSGYAVELSRRLAWSSVRSACGVLRVFLRYLYRERCLERDLSATVQHPQVYRLSTIPRSITWDEVRRMLEAVDRRTPVGKRDYAILLLLVTYGLRAQEVASLTLENVDWRQERLRVPDRKAGHSTGYPLSALVGQAILDYLQAGRPKTTHRQVFLRSMAPRAPLTHSAISGRASHYLHKAGIAVSRAGSHTLRHSCVQRLVEAEFSLKIIGDYVGHRAPSSTLIYSKVDLEALREVACGDGEEVL